MLRRMHEEPALAVRGDQKPEGHAGSQFSEQRREATKVPARRSPHVEIGGQVAIAVAHGLS